MNYILGCDSLVYACEGNIGMKERECKSGLCFCYVKSIKAARYKGMKMLDQGWTHDGFFCLSFGVLFDEKSIGPRENENEGTWIGWYIFQWPLIQLLIMTIPLNYPTWGMPYSPSTTSFAK